MEINDVILYFALKYEGDWDLIYKAIQRKEAIENDFLEKEKKKMKCGYITILDNNYPKNLKEIYKPPFILFYKGNIELLNRNIISFVGSRNCNEYSVKSTEKLIKDIASIDKQTVICSGLALGIDTIAHESSIKENLKTIAILPCGIDICYPSSNYGLYYSIIDKGLLLSEYPFSKQIQKDKIPFRNRIIAGLCSSLVVTSCKNRSGSLVSVRYALESGKDIFVLPHPIDDDSFCNHLIKEGAYIITEGKDLFEKK